MILHNGDCLEIMKSIPDKSIDMILCDLPYGTTACNWDIIIPFDLLWKQYKRVIKENGAICLFATNPFSSKLVASNIKAFKHEWIWEKEKGTGFQVAKFRPMQKHEHILIFTSKGERVNYYPIKEKRDKVYVSTPRNNNHSLSSPLKYSDGKTRIYDSRYPISILRYKRDKDKLHPTQKPVALLEYLIKTYTNEDEVVLDNCMGSGSTGVACVNTNRKFIGIEKDKNYFKIAEERIRNASV